MKNDIAEFFETVTRTNPEIREKSIKFFGDGPEPEFEIEVSDGETAKSVNEKVISKIGELFHDEYERHGVQEDWRLLCERSEFFRNLPPDESEGEDKIS